MQPCSRPATCRRESSVRCGAWSAAAACSSRTLDRPGEPARRSRVLLVGTGLPMADVAYELSRRSPALCDCRDPRRGCCREPDSRAMPNSPESIDFSELDHASSLSTMTTAVREASRRCGDRGIDWRDVMVALRNTCRHCGVGSTTTSAAGPAAPATYWDVHRHQLPPRVGDTVMRLWPRAGCARARRRSLRQRSSEGGLIGLQAADRFHRIVGIRPRRVAHRTPICARPSRRCWARCSKPGTSRRTVVGSAGGRRARPAGRQGRSHSRGLYYVGPCGCARAGRLRGHGRTRTAPASSALSRRCSAAAGDYWGRQSRGRLKRPPAPLRRTPPGHTVIPHEDLGQNYAADARFHSGGSCSSRW